MPASFEWEFEEDERPRREPGPPPGRPDRRRRLWRGGILLCLLLIGVGLRFWWVAYQRALVENEVTLRAAVALELRAIAGRDVELFRSRQDPADATWRERQIARYVSVTSSHFAPAPGLEPVNRAPEVRQVRLSGRNAQVDLIFWFDDEADGPTNPLPFFLTWSYRHADDGNWYHVAPLDDRLKPYARSAGVRPGTEAGKRARFVNGPTAMAGDRPRGLENGHADNFVAQAAPDFLLSIQATQAEADLLDPIADELGRLAVQGCIWLSCPADTDFNLSFEDVPGPTVNGDRWRLPTLFLVGRPGNAAARDAWERALKRWLVEALARWAVSDDVPTRTILYEQLVQRLQAALDLDEPPAPDVPLLARTVAAGEQSTLPELWAARREPNDLGDARLRQAEVAAFLTLLEQRVGPTQLLALLPMLNGHDRAIDEALLSLVGQSAEAFGDTWYTFLSGLTGERILPFSTFPRVAAADPLLPPQPILIPPPREPGDQIALLCDRRVWVGNADGSDLFPLTPPGQWFYDLEWSPDGRWLMARWVYEQSDPRDALYYLAADGGWGYPLTYEVLIEPGRRILSPDGRYLAYEAGSEVWGVEIETGDTRRLPGMPIWSPRGDRMIYVSDDANRAWLAGADWGDPRPIAGRRGLDWAQAIWSPDGAHLAMPVYEGRPDESSSVIYDLATERLTAHFTTGDLAAGFFDQEQSYLTTGDPFVPLELRSQRSVWPLGWSADGRQLLLWGQWTAGDQGAIDVTLLARAADGGAPSTVLYGVETRLNNIAWSPTDPEQLMLRWRPGAGQGFAYETVLFDLSAGSIYTDTDIREAAWSPDGAWVALVGRDQITVVDSTGQTRLRFEPPGRCREAVWNPAADLSQLERSVMAGGAH